MKNIKTVEKLIEQNLIKKNGLDIYQKRKVEKTGIHAFEQRNKALPENYISEFKKNKEAWNYFNESSHYYKKTTIQWVMSAKKEETRLRRLNTLIEDSSQGIKLKQFGRRKNKQKRHSNGGKPAQSGTSPRKNCDLQIGW